MAWAKRRQPIRTYDSTIPYYKGSIGIVEVSEYTCPICGSEQVRLVIVRAKGVHKDREKKYAVGLPVPDSSELDLRGNLGNRSIGFKCEKCGLISSGSTTLTTDILRKDLNARQKVRVP